MVKTKEKTKESKYQLIDDIYKRFGLPDFPYRCRLSFVPLIRRWEKELQGEDPSNQVLAKEIARRLQEAPEFLKPIEDLSLLQKHEELIDLLLAGFFPPLTEEKQMARVSAPFSKLPFYQTPLLDHLDEYQTENLHFQTPKEQVSSMIIARAGSHILNVQYNYPTVLPSIFPFSAIHPDTGINRFFQTEIDLSLTEVKALKPLPKLSRKEMDELMNTLERADHWLEQFPPDGVEFQGLIFTQILENSETESLSQMKHHLLNPNALIDPELFPRLRHFLCSMLQQAELQVGLSALDFPIENTSHTTFYFNNSLVKSRYPWPAEACAEDPLYMTACQKNQPVVLQDLRLYQGKSPAAELLLKEGYRSLILAPLFNSEEKLIGLFELASRQRGALDNFLLMKLKDVITLLSIAVERSRSEMDNRIDAIIRDEYTSVHPSVEWRFEENAYNLWRRQESKAEDCEVEPIVFPGVFPLFGQADIVHSSGHRNDAIQADLLNNLQQISQAIELIQKKLTFHLLDQAALEVEDMVRDLNRGITSSNEYHALQFIQNTIHPIFSELQERNPDLRATLDAYFRQIDPELDILYDRRKAYEQSVAIINRSISDMLDEEQARVQEIVPHFYEKYETDGVAYNIYAGDSILRNRSFKPHHLRNLRLWQLTSMCRITRKVYELQQRMPIPLTTAQLILVHSSPLSIRFRMDEKRFDVDGTYNVRYEIVKKRIDKALVKGRNERLTLSDRIAIAYQQEEDRNEYLGYLKYLKRKGWIEARIEDLEVEPLQGVHGLKALRVKVKYPEGAKA